MATALISHLDCLDHHTPLGHPEEVGRLVEVTRALEDERFQHLIRVDAPAATDAQLLRAHSQAHLDVVSAAIPPPGADMKPIDQDTWASPGSLRAALRAAGAVVEAVDMVMAGHAANAFCAVRPPGHHAERDGAMGFCLFNNIAVGALHALDAHGLDRVAVIDFDVHHGNGTQDIFWSDGRVLFASVHEWPLYPGTGAPEETGAAGAVVNAVLRAGDGGDAFREVFTSVVEPRIAAHRPELILISAGFDAHMADPLAHIGLTERDFVWATDRICALAKAHTGGKVVSSLEGGYDAPALGRSVAAHVGALMGHSAG